MHENRKMRETSVNNKEFSDIFMKILGTSAMLLKLPIGYDVKYENEQEKYEVFNELYTYYDNLNTNQNLLNKLDINEANDLIVFYKELLNINHKNEEEEIKRALKLALEDFTKDVIIEIIEQEEGGWQNGAEILNEVDPDIARRILYTEL